MIYVIKNEMGGIEIHENSMELPANAIEISESVQYDMLTEVTTFDKIEADHIAQLELDRLAKIEADRIAAEVVVEVPVEVVV